MLREIGVRPQVNLIDYTKEYLPIYLTNAGKFDGLVYRSGVASADDAVVYIDWRYRSNSGEGWIGFDKNGRGDQSGDPELDAMILKARQEFDVDKRKSQVYDIQRYIAKAAYAVSLPGSSDTLQIAWPVLANFQVFQSDRRGTNFNWWLDETQPPLSRA
jgi:ABC-type transport system substrate-binding protein